MSEINSSDYTPELRPEDAEKLERIERYVREMVSPEDCLPANDSLFGQTTRRAISSAGSVSLVTIVATYDLEERLKTVSVHSHPDGLHAEHLERPVWEDRFTYVVANGMIAIYENGEPRPVGTTMPGKPEYSMGLGGLHRKIVTAYLGHSPGDFR